MLVNYFRKADFWHFSNRNAQKSNTYLCSSLGSYSYEFSFKSDNGGHQHFWFLGIDVKIFCCEYFLCKSAKIGNYFFQIVCNLCLALEQIFSTNSAQSNAVGFNAAQIVKGRGNVM